LGKLPPYVAFLGAGPTITITMVAVLEHNWGVGKEVRVDVIADFAWTDFEDLVAEVAAGDLSVLVQLVDGVDFLCLQLGFTSLVSRILLFPPL